MKAGTCFLVCFVGLLIASATGESILAKLAAKMSLMRQEPQQRSIDENGLSCFHCFAGNNENSCLKRIEQCSRGDVCVSSWSKTSNYMYDGCVNRQICDGLQRDTDLVTTCCDTNLCNTNL